MIKYQQQMLKQFFQKHNIRVVQSIWLVYVHIFGLMGLFYAIYRYDLLIKLLVIYNLYHQFYSLGITAGAHRLWAHKSYSATLPLRIFLMLMNSGMFQGSIFHWARDHRIHHKYSDTPLDPHNINKGFFFAHCGWLLVNKSPQLIKAGKQIDMSDILKDPVVRFQKKYYLPLAFFMCFLLPTTFINFFTEVGLFQAFILNMFYYIVCLNATWCVNSICHMFGTRYWNPNIEARDNYFVAIWTNGQGYHNWHHEYPFDWRASKDQWYMINGTARFIQFCAFLGLAKVKK